MSRVIAGDMFDVVYFEGDKKYRDVVPVWRIPMPCGRCCNLAPLHNKRDNALRRAWIKAEQKEKSQDGWHTVNDPSFDDGKCH